MLGNIVTHNVTNYWFHQRIIQHICYAILISLSNFNIWICLFVDVRVDMVHAELIGWVHLM